MAGIVVLGAHIPATKAMFTPCLEPKDTLTTSQVCALVLDAVFGHSPRHLWLRAVICSRPAARSWKLRPSGP
jgi:hypothetical protein